MNIFGLSQKSCFLGPFRIYKILNPPFEALSTLAKTVSYLRIFDSALRNNTYGQKSCFLNKTLKFMDSTINKIQE